MAVGDAAGAQRKLAGAAAGRAPGGEAACRGPACSDHATRTSASSTPRWGRSGVEPGVNRGCRPGSLGVGWGSPGWGRAGLGPGRRASCLAPRRPLNALLQPQDGAEPWRPRLPLGQKLGTLELKLTPQGPCEQWAGVKDWSREERPGHRPTPPGGWTAGRAGGVTQDGPRPAPSPPCAPSCSAGSFRFVANSNALACEE